MEAAIPTGTLLALLLATARTAAWLMVSPPFNGRAIPTTVKGMLALAIALPVLPGTSAHVPELTTWSVVSGVVTQAIVGAGLGFLTALIFAAIQAAGDLLDVFGGFSMAFAFDPMSFSGNNSVLGRFYGMLATALLFVTDGHQIIIRGFTLSFEAVPLDHGLSLSTLGSLLTEGLGRMFLSAIMIAGPLIVVLFCADIGLGLLNRIAPALNPFAIGFPAKIGLTLLLVGSAMFLLPAAVRGTVQGAVEAMFKAMGK
ncbi:flagellar biosynthetic protein FliR [Saccharothrix violaceirubra]|uniref:Flagellar biosynthetic protein FliR n=1 Tax=Saccharothrix violaceirubra TaxID=413306 RepID=A0A7W7T895_9PSEU|nr:flagellar biosynthetic protein FliR [Saccharothrix violaceirubra]MBB4968378.1 flagellar biosynthetic protein FliR [Saccharothrix violaceirubra]